MNNPAPDHPDKTDLRTAQEALCTAFLHHLGQHFPALEAQQSALLAEADALLEQQNHLLIDELARTNLHLSAVVLVTYRALQGQLEGQQLIPLLEQAFCTRI